MYSDRAALKREAALAKKAAAQANALCPKREPAPVVVPAPVPAPAPPADTDGDGVIDALDRCPGTPIGTKVDKDGCPEVIVPVQKPAPAKFCNPVVLDIKFDFDKADIKPEFHNELNKLGEFLKEFPKAKGTIEGHTDSLGGKKYNERGFHCVVPKAYAAISSKTSALMPVALPSKVLVSPSRLPTTKQEKAGL